MSDLKRVYKDASVQDEATGWISTRYKNRPIRVDVGITGTGFSGVVTLQKRIYIDDAWEIKNVKEYYEDTNNEYIDDTARTVQYRLIATTISGGSVFMELYK